MAVNEIAEIENDESPNPRAHNRRVVKRDSMGFQPDGVLRMVAEGNDIDGPASPFETTKGGFEEATHLPMNISYNKTENMFGATNK